MTAVRDGCGGAWAKKRPDYRASEGAQENCSANYSLLYDTEECVWEFLEGAIDALFGITRLSLVLLVGWKPFSIARPGMLQGLKASLPGCWEAESFSQRSRPSRKKLAGTMRHQTLFDTL